MDRVSLLSLNRRLRGAKHVMFANHLEVTWSRSLQQLKTLLLYGLISGMEPSQLLTSHLLPFNLFHAEISRLRRSFSLRNIKSPEIEVLYYSSLASVHNLRVEQAYIFGNLSFFFLAYG